MAGTDDLFKRYLLDLDNCKELETSKDSNSLITEATALLSLVTCVEKWEKLKEFNFNVDQIKDYFNTFDNNQLESYFQFAIACSMNFVQCNFTGPQLPAQVEEFLNSDLFSNIDFEQLLSINNEEINPNTKFPSLLVAAKVVFWCSPVGPSTWWLWRLTFIHQQVLDELSPSLLSYADGLSKDLQELSLDAHTSAKLEIEQAQLYLLYRNVIKAHSHVERAADILGVKYELAGKLGRRTKFQEEDIAQLSLEVVLMNKDDIQRPQVNDFDIPKDVDLDDNIRLEKIKYSGCPKNVNIPNTEQKLLVTALQEMITSKPHDELLYEELEQFLNLILRQSNTWSVRVVTLLLRSKLESKHNRTIERALSQCEEIINYFKKDSPHALVRIGGVWGTGLQPMWKTQAQYADLMLNLGLVKASLVLYLRLQLWEEVIVCYVLLKMKHKAAEIIKQQLDLKPTVKLWCLLGDATDDVSCYEKAWEISKKRSHRAQRHWGQYYFGKKEYLECISHFEKSVSINPLQAIVWSRLGFAALETENWQVAATAYRRYTTLEPDRFEAWNNLALAYIKLGNKRSAHQALSDALRCNFESWKVWENFLVVSNDLLQFMDVIRAYHRILDLKQRYLNHKVLSTLVYSVCSNCQTDLLLKKIRELFGRITSIHPDDAVVWELYANLAPSLTVRAQRYQRALKGYTQPNWDNNAPVCVKVLNVCKELLNIALDKQVDCKDPILSSVKMNVVMALTAVKKQNWDEIKPEIKTNEELLLQLVEKYQPVEENK